MGDRAGQEALFRQQVRRVRHVLSRLLGDRPEVEDATQDTMARVFRSLPRYRGESTLSTWVDRIAVRVAIDYLQRRGRTPRGADDPDEIAGLEPPADDRMLREEIALRLDAALDKLDARKRIAFVLHVIEGRSMTEIAELMEVTTVATKSRVLRARQELERRSRHDSLLSGLIRKK